MQKNENYYAEIGLKAALRVQEKVYKQAAETNTPLPFWKDGKVVYEIPPLPQTTRDS